MNITLERVHTGKDHTNGIIRIDGLVWSSIEDGYRIPKVHGETRIPEGTYDIKKRTGSPMANRYDEKFGAFHQGMLHIQAVPGFEWVYIHVGNVPADTEGCVLIGNTADYRNGFAGESTAAYREFYPIVSAALDRGENVTITIS